MLRSCPWNVVEDFLKDNPDVWLARIRSAVDTVPTLSPMVDSSKIAVIGYSEGGTPAIQLARTDVQVGFSSTMCLLINSMYEGLH